ncbi:RNA 3'-terminal phosphate cyclase [Halosimplex salinum]|uniref:RNA 3'-terminal phosphate cyclase n=1 Tax=Halosimplex salinum TaxID=1710538 RepID=UPI000F489744|nr:RNA 3'-terminal phosphate cyclase [Halosimplex salinum]
MLEVDGSQGGGQLVRSALTLSMLSGEAVELDEVRGNRSTPGLKPQHLAAVETAADVADADVEGAEQGSERVTFEPGRIGGGRYEADIGTAGSVSLLFDTFLPLATRIDEPLSITATGGTDVKWSPPLAYYREVKLPLLRRFGLAAAVEVDRTGFYPVGGGRATLRLWPSSLSRIDLGSGLSQTGARVYSKAAAELADAEVAERQAAAATDALDGLGVETVEHRTTYVATSNPGSVVVVRLDGADSVAGFDAYGSPGTPAEEVSNRATDPLRRFLGSGAAVDVHLADQLLVFLGLAGGRVAVPGVSDHLSSSLDLLATFGQDVSVDDSGPAPVVFADR